MLYEVTFHMSINTHYCSKIKAEQSRNIFIYSCITLEGDNKRRNHLYDLKVVYQPFCGLLHTGRAPQSVTTDEKMTQLTEV